MPATLTGNVRVDLQATYQNAVGLAAGIGSIAGNQLIQALTSGVGANQVDKIYSESQKSIAASGTYDIDLSGSLTDVFGAVISFARVKLIAVFASLSNTNNVLVGAAAATQFIGPLGSATDKINVRPGGCALLFAPDATAWPVVNAASDLLRFTNSAGTTAVLFDFIIMGASA